MNLESKSRLQQLTTGVSLVTIIGAELIKKDGVPVTPNEGEMGLRVRFESGDKKVFDQDYWLGGQRQFDFDNMCRAAKIDQSNPKFRKESKGRRLYLCIREVWKINGTETVTDPLTGEPEIAYQIFKYLPFEDNGKKPHVPGDPELDKKGQASGDFVDYIDVSDNEPATESNPVTEPPKQDQNTDEWSDF